MPTPGLGTPHQHHQQHHVVIRTLQHHRHKRVVHAGQQRAQQLLAKLLVRRNWAGLEGHQCVGGCLETHLPSVGSNLALHWWWQCGRRSRETAQQRVQCNELSNDQQPRTTKNHE